MKIENARTVGGTRGKQSEKLAQLRKKQENSRENKARVGSVVKLKDQEEKTGTRVPWNIITWKRAACVNVERRRGRT